MYAETSQKKMSNARIAFALLCGLAVCCSVMYITADAGDEYMHEIVKGDGAAAVDAGTSVGSTDVLKAGQIYTETPDGRMRLMDYFNNVEKEISDEVANRKSDIASVRAQMARDFAFNAASRAKLKRNMLHKMAQYAKKARDDLNHAMARTQERFAKQANLANRRYKATQRRDKRTNKLIKHDKHEAAKNLKLAVDGWQKSTTAWASATNARIDRMNKHVAANAAQIKENAKKARKDLETTMASWDHKVAKFRSDSKTARSKLSQQFKAQDKATRAWASNKIKGLVASTSAQFNDVNTKMAKNRHEVDMALKKATMRFEATLNAQKALENKRFAESMANIAAAKKEAEEKTKAASSEFKVALLQLGSTVKEQVAKVNARIDKTANVVRSDAAAQAKVNANVNAEMGRMMKVANHRYVQHLKHDAELQNAIAKDKDETDSKLNKMALEFNQALSAVRGQLAKDRKHSETKLKQGTGAVWAALEKNREMQEKKNAEMAAATRRMKLDAMDAVRTAKAEFQKKIKSLGKVVAANDKKADAKIKHLTGVVDAEAQKSKKGRQELAAMEEANKLELKHSIRKAIETGEARAKQVEANGEKMDKDTKWLVNNKLSSEITKLREETDSSVEALNNLSKEAREEMRKEMIFAIRSAADVAKTDLDLAVKDGVKKMIAFEAKAATQHADSEAARQALKAEIADNAKEVSRMIKDAVDTDARAQTALGQAVAAKLKKTNTQIDAVSAQMKVIATKNRADIAAQNKNTLAAISKEQERAAGAVAKFSSDDAARQKAALDFMAEQMKIAGEEVDAKFGAAYTQLADDRSEAEEALSGAVNGLNDALAKQAALADSRFEKTVSNIQDARKEASDAVAELRSDFASELIATTALVKRVETNLADQVATVSGEVTDYRAFQLRVNRKVTKEKERIEELSNKRFSESKKARGKLRQLMDENKQAAAAEVAALAKELDTKLDKARARNAHNRRSMAKDLTDATELFYEKLSDQQKAHMADTDALNAATKAASAASAADLARAQSNFDSKIVMLTNTVTANAKHAEDNMAKLTGVVHNIAEAAAKDRDNIKKATKAMEDDLNKALARAISIGEAKAKAVEQRIAEHLKGTKRFLQVELNGQVEAAADNVFDILEGKRQKIADNYLSLKAYAVSAADKVDDYVAKGKGRALSSIGDLLSTVGAQAAVHAPAEEGLGMGGSALPSIFSGKNVKVSNAVGAINGLVNEYTESCQQVRNRWPMGLGKYLLDRLEISMTGKGVLQVDKVEGKSGNFVYINGRSVGLSNKMSDFSVLASRMSTYESILAKLTAKIEIPKKPVPFYAGPPEWEGN
jgi:hypothetical protein